MSKNPNELPPLDEEIINVAFSREELVTFANLMAVVSQTFESLARQASEQQDASSFAVLNARYKLSNFYAQKLASSYKIGEPTSKDIH